VISIEKPRLQHPFKYAALECTVAVERKNAIHVDLIAA